MYVRIGYWLLLGIQIFKFAVDGFCSDSCFAFDSAAVDPRPEAAGGGYGGVEESNYAAAVLAKNQISNGRARWRTMPMACVHYGGCVVGLSMSAVLHGEHERDELRIGSFFVKFVVFWV